MRIALLLRMMVAAPLAVVAGCASVPPDAGFPQVQQAVADRAGLRVQWNQGSTADQAVTARVNHLLSGELSADQAVQVALLNNRHLQATYEDLMVAQADLVAAGLLRNPVLDAELRFSTAGGGTGVTLSVVQDFIDIFLIPLRQQVAGARFDAAKARVTGEVLDLAGRTRQAYYSLAASQQLLEMRQQVRQATEAAYDIARRLRQAGNTRELDLLSEQTLYEQAKLDLRQAEVQVAIDREALNRLMGIWGPQATTWRVPGRLPEVPDAPLLAAPEIEAQAIARSLDLQSQQLQITAAASALGIAAPLALLLREGGAGATAEREVEGGWSVGPAASIPLPLFNQGQPAIAVAQAELRRARQRYFAMAVDIRSQARAARETALAWRDRSVYFRSIMLPLQQRIVDQTQLQYNAMQVSPLQLLQARQQQIDTGAGYIRSLRNYWHARVALDQILAGRLPAGLPVDVADNTTSTPRNNAEGH